MPFEDNVLLKLKRAYSKDEYVSMLQKELSEVKFKYGELLSEVEELRAIPTGERKTKRQWLQSEIFREVNDTNKRLEARIKGLNKEVQLWREKYFSAKSHPYE